MNFCGGGIDQQVFEPPIVSMGPLEDDFRGNNSSSSNPGPYQQTMDMPVHRSDTTKSSNRPQPSSGLVRNEVLRINKKKLQQPQPACPTARETSRSLMKNVPPNNNTRSRSRSRSRSRIRGFGGKKNTSSLEESMRGMEINLPKNNQGQSVDSSSRVGASSFSSMKTLDTLLKRMENGFRVTIHNGADPAGKRVFLTLLQNRTCLLIRPVEDDVDNAPSIKFPVRTILRLEIGKTKSSVLGRSIYDYIPPMTCFSIVVKLWSEAETYFDFEAGSVIEREALISTLMVVLDQIHNTSMSSPLNGTDSLLQAKKEAENTGELSSAGYLSPGKRTKMPSANFSEGNGDPEGLELTLANSGTPKTTSKRSSSKSKPLRQRQWQPAAHDSVDDNVPGPLSPPRTSHTTRQSFLFDIATKPTTPQTNKQKSTIKSAPKSPYNANSPLEVVVVNNNTFSAEDERRDEPPEATGVVIMDSQHPNETADGIELGLEGEDNFNFDIPNQGLPMSKIHFTPSRNFADVNSNGCCNFTPNTEGHENGNQQVSWCTDDICTLALKDIAETCTGMFDHPDSFPGDGVAKNHNLSKEDYENAACKPGCTAEEGVIVKEYIAGVLAGPGGFDAWNAQSSQQAPAKEKTRKNRIKNRASQMNAQSTRLQTLRNEMTFAASLKKSKEKMQYVQTTKSLDDADAGRLRQAQKRSINSHNSSALMESMLGGMAMAKPDSDDDTLYYDSDPEDSRPRTRGVRRASANRRNTVTSEEEKQYPVRAVLSGVGFEKIAVGKKLKKLDEELIIDIVQAMRNETLILMWHPTQSAARPNRSSVCVNLWIESGVYLVDGSFLLPRLSWSLAYENNLDTKKLNVSKTEPEQIDLLDVCRIRVTEKVDRKLHPFADPRRAFIIETQEEVYMFEAQSAEERNRIVYGYKLVIARLASLLMLRDSRAVEEFFGSASAMVPGGFTVGK